MFASRSYSHDSKGNVQDGPPPWWLVLERKNHGTYSTLYVLKLGSVLLHILWIMISLSVVLFFISNGTPTAALTLTIVFVPITGALFAEWRNRRRRKREKS